MLLKNRALEIHKKNQGKIKIESKVPIRNDEDLALAYTPGVAEPCKQIHARTDAVYDYTTKGNMVAVISNGTAVLGLGDIGPEAAMPVMEGKALLFKAFGGVDAFPICLATKDVNEMVRTVKLLEPTFGGINLEDIAAPECFDLEKRLIKEMGIPVFHDDQHGTAVVVLAGLINALKLMKKRIEEVSITVNGAGAAAMAVTKLIMAYGAQHIIMCDSNGIIYEGRNKGMNSYKEEMSRITNKKGRRGDLKEAIKEADVFIGLSKANMVTKQMVKTMAPDPIIFALANPVPEIMPDEAKEAGAAVIVTGRSDFPNQVNNVLAFPGIFRGALDTRARVINEEMKIAAANAIAGLVTEREIRRDYIIPKPFDPRVAPKVAAAVAKAAMDTGSARINVDIKEIEKRTLKLALI